MRVLYVYNTKRKKQLEEYENGTVPSTLFYGLPYMHNYSIDATFSDSSFTSIANPIIQPIETFIGFRLVQPSETLYAMRSYDVILSTHNSCTHLLLLTKLLTKFEKPLVNINVSLLNWSMTTRTYKRNFVRHILKSATQTVVYASYQIEKFKEIFNIPEDKCKFIPFGADDEYFVPQKMDRYDYILSVGKDIGRDYTTLLESIKNIPSKVAIVCGDQNLRGLSLPDNVKKIVNIPYSNVREMYARSKFIVLPLHPNRGSDAVGHTTLLESMAMGKAVIVSATPAVADYVDDWKTGILVKPYDVKEMRVAIEYLLDNPQEAEKIGKNARKVIEEKFNNRIYARNLASLLWNVYKEG